ncbi:uncharacterized protein LOC143247285 [Tachypleus tridentatus]|uniref:uncharacterized protein LOC143247285 n=1 Tax=Tachypleus tridentatus TaxID=6853 RepID=UPI003FD4FEBD
MDWWRLCVSFICCRSYKKEDTSCSQPVTERKGPLYNYSTPLRGYGAIGSGQSSRNMSTNLSSSTIEDRKLYSRRNYGYIRPPNIRRDSQAQATLKGWLFRLEGGALRQWKRRWCVLTDYCLFYYKDFEEDKLLGSIILPSYRISPCCANDKITRRFAFKAEHQNMKTYFFAAESRELMIQWMNALCLATIMQTFTRRQFSTDQLSMPPTPGLNDDNSQFASSQPCKVQDRGDLSKPSYSSLVSTQSTCDHSTLNLSRDVEGNIIANDGTSDSGFLSSSERYLSQYISQSVIPSSVCSKGRIGHSYYTVGPPKPKRLHASCITLPQGAPDLVPPYDIDPRGGRFIKSSDQRRFYYDDRYNFDSRWYDNWENEYNYWTWQGDMCYKPQLFFRMSPGFSTALRPRSRHKSEWDYENLSVYGHASQPNGNMIMDPFLQRPHSDNSANRIREFDLQSVDIPFVGSDLSHSPWSWKEIEMDDSDDMLDRIAQDPSCLYSMYSNRNLEALPGKNHLRSVYGSYYDSISDLRHQQPWSSGGNSWYPRTESDTEQKECISQKLQVNNSDGIFITSPMFINENIHEHFDAGHQKHTGLVPTHSFDNSDGQDVQSIAQQEESVKSLMECREKMLLSPMVGKQSFKENRNVEVSTTNISPEGPPPRPPLPEEYSQQVLQSIEAQEMQQRMWRLHLQSKQINKAVHSIPLSFFKSNDTSETLYEPKKLSHNELEPQIHRQLGTASGNKQETDNSQRTKRASSRSREPPVSSSRVRESSRPKVRRTSWRGKSPGHRKAVGRAIMSDSELYVHQSSKVHRLIQHSSSLSSSRKSICISAGELLDKTHEELVLFLIQLRQSQTQLSQALERCQIQVLNEQRMVQVKPQEKRHAEKYKKLCQQLEDLQKEYELTHPLVNLVENLVRLGTLCGATERKSASLSKLERVGIAKYIPSEKILEFANHLQERQRLRGEIDGVEMSVIDSEGLREKMTRLYHLDRLVQEESSHFASLQNDKEMLEQSLKTLQKKLIELSQDNPIEMEKLKKQQRLIEKELSHIRSHLSKSAMKLEERTSDVCKAEHKILVFRQKLQHALAICYRRKELSSVSKLDLEAELLRIQSFLERLAKRRQEINNIIETLKFKSKHKHLSSIEKIRKEASGVIGSVAVPPKRRHCSSYMETDLDSCTSQQETGVARKPESQKPLENFVVDHSETALNPSLLGVNQDILARLTQDSQVRVSHHDQQAYSSPQQQNLGSRVHYTDQQLDESILNPEYQNIRLNPQNQPQDQSVNTRISQGILPDRNIQHHPTQNQPDQNLRLVSHEITQNQSGQHLSQVDLTQADEHSRIIFVNQYSRYVPQDQVKPDQSELHGRYNYPNQPDINGGLSQLRHARLYHPDKNERLRQPNYITKPHHTYQNGRLCQPDQSTRCSQQELKGRISQQSQCNRHNQTEHNVRMHQPDQHGSHNQPYQNVGTSQPEQCCRYNQPDQDVRMDQPNVYSRYNQPYRYVRVKHPDEYDSCSKSNQYIIIHQTDKIGGHDEPDQSVSTSHRHQYTKNNQIEKDKKMSQPDQYDKHIQFYQHDKSNQPDHRSKLPKSNQLSISNQQEETEKSSQLEKHVSRPSQDVIFNQSYQCVKLKPNQLNQYSRLGQVDQDFSSNRSERHIKQKSEKNVKVVQSDQDFSSNQSERHAKEKPEENVKVIQSDQHSRLGQLDQNFSSNQSERHAKQKPEENVKVIQSDQHSRLGQLDQDFSSNQSERHAKQKPEENVKVIQSDQHSRLGQLDQNFSPNQSERLARQKPEENVKVIQSDQHSRLGQLDQHFSPNQSERLARQKPEENVKVIQSDQHSRLGQLDQHFSPNQSERLARQKPEENVKVIQSDQHSRLGQLDQDFSSNQSERHAKQKPEENVKVIQSDQHSRLGQLDQNFSPNQSERLARQKPEENVKVIQSDQHSRLGQLDQHFSPNQSERLARQKPEENVKVIQSDQHSRLGQLDQHFSPNQSERLARQKPEENVKVIQSDQHSRLGQLDQHFSSNQSERYARQKPEENVKVIQSDQHSRPGQLGQHLSSNQSERHTRQKPEENVKVIQLNQHSRFKKSDEYIRPNQQTQDMRSNQPANPLDYTHEPSIIPSAGLSKNGTSVDEVSRTTDSHLSDTKKVSYDDKAEIWLIEETDYENGHEDDDKLFEAVVHRPNSLFSPSHTVQNQRQTFSAHERLFGGSSTSPFFTSSTEHKLNSYQSQSSPRRPGQINRKPRRRHHTITGTPFPNRLSPRMNFRMDRCSRTASTPDIVRSTIRKTEVFNEKLIDRELGLPQKIDIPERYIEDEPENLSAAEKRKRNEKAEDIRRMLSEAATYEEPTEIDGTASESIKKKMDEERKKRAHLLALNHTIAKEVMEKSKLVAMIATLERLDSDSIWQKEEENMEDEDWSPVQPPPITQQRENYLT